MIVTTSNLKEFSFWRYQYVTYLVDTRIKNLCPLLAIYLGNLTSHQSERKMQVLIH